MSDRETVRLLNKTEPNYTWEQIVDKQIQNGFTGDDIYREIIKSSQRSRQSVNEALGVN